MTPRERIIAAVQGKPTDRVPFAAWYHFSLTPPAGPWSDMAEQEIAFCRRYKPDFLKVMHDIPFEPMPPIEEPADWAKLSVLDPQTGNFGDQLFTVRQIRAGIGADIPMIETIFGVYHYANELSEGRLLSHLRSQPDQVHAGLSALATSLARYAQSCLDAGCDGVYYALSGASAGGATRDEYLHHFLPYDRQILESAHGAPFNVLHMHGYDDLYFDLAHDLPANAVCWSDRAGGPSLAVARQVHSGCLIGGLDEVAFAKMTEAEIVAQARDAIRQAGTQGFILAPGCAIPTDTDPALIDCLREAVSA